MFRSLNLLFCSNSCSPRQLQPCSYSSVSAAPISVRFSDFHRDEISDVQQVNLHRRHLTAHYYGPYGYSYGSAMAISRVLLQIPFCIIVPFPVYPIFVGCKYETNCCDDQCILRYHKRRYLDCRTAFQRYISWLKSHINTLSFSSIHHHHHHQSPLTKSPSPNKTT